MNARKRAFDVAASSAGLVLLSPLMAILAVLIARDGGPVFFLQERVGRHGRPFRIVKLRTMRHDAERCGLQITVGNDQRITGIGAWLRRTKLDELPQLLNVFKGEMSIVGPRPEVPRYVACYDGQQRRVLESVPGLTDPASLAYRDESDLLGGVVDPELFYIHELMPEKISINLEYQSRATLRSDLGIVLRTMSTMLPQLRGSIRSAGSRTRNSYNREPARQDR